METQPTRGTPADLAIHAGGYFFDLAGTFIKELPHDVQRQNEFLNHPRNVGRFIAATTNLAFAIELLLKGLVLKFKQKALTEHKLIDLFNDLPKWVQNEIQMRYSYRFEKLKRKLNVISFVVSNENKPLAGFKKHAHILKGADEQDVKKLLGVEKNAFQTWRYVYEKVPAGGSIEVTVHIWHLALLVNAINDVLTPPEKRP